MSLDPDHQEWVVRAIIAFVLFGMGRRLFHAWFALPLAKIFLKRGYVKWAFRLRSSASSR